MVYVKSINDREYLALKYHIKQLNNKLGISKDTFYDKDSKLIVTKVMRLLN